MSTNLVKEMWQRRSLIALFALGEVKLRYRNSVLGFLWSFLEPLLMLSVLYLVFTNIFKGVIENYPLYLLLGLIIWNMFSRATSMGLTSLLDKAAIIQKTNFRREIIVVSSVATPFIMMTFEFFAFAVFVVVFQFVPPITIILLPLVLIDLFFLSLGISLMMSSMSVYFRDLKFIWQVLLQALFFLSPIIYKMDTFPENIRSILGLNPLVPLLETAQNITLYNSLPDINSVIYIVGSTLVLFFTGYAIFRIKDKKLVDEL